MTTWILHPLNARHGLTPVLSELRAAIRQAIALAGPHIELPDFDLVARAETGGAARGGIASRCPAPGLIEITLDPARFDETLLIRSLLREFLPLLRHEGPGRGPSSRGVSLGEALVSEGLAGHFVQHVLGGRPDSVDQTALSAGVARQAMNEWARRDFDFPRWFHGKGDMRYGTGNGLGYRLVAGHLAQNPGQDVISLAWVQADAFRASLRQIVGADKEAACDETGEDAGGNAKGKAGKDAEKADNAREAANGAGSDIEDGPPASG